MISGEKLDGGECGEYSKTLEAHYCVLTLERLGRLTVIIEHVENNPFSLPFIIVVFASALQFGCV